MKLVLLSLVAVVAVGFFFLSLMNYLNPQPSGPTPPDPVPTPTVGATSAPPTGVPEPDLNPPELPVPKNWDEVDQWLTANAIYTESVEVPTNCTVGHLDASAATQQQLQDHINLLTGCLTMVWQDPMRRAGFEMSRPPATVYSQPITTACGDADTHDVFYCGGDQRIYYAIDLPEIFRSTSPEVVRNPFFLGNVIGHEYGHAVQARTGILISQVYLRQQAEKERDLELSRRKEMQADCLAGTFLNAVAQASQMTGVERTALWEVSYAVGDDIINADPTYVGDHGSGAGRRDWFEIGLASDQVNVCNTWTAPAGQVR